MAKNGKNDKAEKADRTEIDEMGADGGNAGIPPLTEEETKWLESLRQKIEYVPSDSIKLSPNRERRNDGTVPALANSIRKLGFRSPIYVDAAGIVRIGHTRLKAARALGLKIVPVVRLEADLPAEKIRLLQLADNKIAEMSEWNFPELDKTLDELREAFANDFPDLDLDDFGFANFLKTGPVDDLFLPENQKPRSEDGSSENDASGEDSEVPETFVCPHCGKTILRSEIAS